MSSPWMRRANVLVLLMSLPFLLTPVAFGAAAGGPPAPGLLPPTWPGAPTWWPDQGGAAGAPGDLAPFIDALRQSVERLAEWVQAFRQMVSDMLTRMIWEFPGQLPEGADLTELTRQIAALPQALRGAPEAVWKKLLAPVVPGSDAERHHAYIESNPAIAHEAMGIAAADQVVAGGIVQQRSASEATAAAAMAVARDLRPRATAARANEIGHMLVSTAQDLPSSRAGIELLVAGVGTGLQQQADLAAATADRLTVLVQQTAQVSQQIGALAATAGVLTLRQAEHDRRILDAQLGFADAVSTAAQVFRDVLTGAGETRSPEPQLRPLY